MENCCIRKFDPYVWSSNDCYAPIMSMLEIRLLTSLAVCHKRILKNGDIKQAFVQATLPDNEKYILKPPPGCPNTPKPQNPKTPKPHMHI